MTTKPYVESKKQVVPEKVRRNFGLSKKISEGFSEEILDFGAYQNCLCGDQTIY